MTICGTTKQLFESKVELHNSVMFLSQQSFRPFLNENKHVPAESNFTLWEFFFSLIASFLKKNELTPKDMLFIIRNICLSFIWMHELCRFSWSLPQALVQHAFSILSHVLAFHTSHIPLQNTTSTLSLCFSGGRKYNGGWKRLALKSMHCGYHKGGETRLV